MKIVCINTGTFNKGINEINDIVSFYDSDVELNGSGYKGFKIIEVEGQTIDEFKKIINLKQPEKATEGEMVVWKNSEGKWCDLVNEPKYAFSMKNITESEIISLCDTKTELAVKNNILNKVVENIHLDSKNNVQVIYLNL